MTVETDAKDFSPSNVTQLDIRNGVIHYKIRQQDGTFAPMTVKDTTSNRLFVQWVQVHD
jgi:hypothetical protein